MQQNKNKGKDADRTDGHFSSKNVKHDPQSESSRTRNAPGPAGDVERHTTIGKKPPPNE